MFAAVLTHGEPLAQLLLNTSVTPDELLIPTQEDLAAERDPVLSRAANLIGLKIEPERTGQMFPVEWRH